jgi:CheY-like chemotaxis protein
MRHAQKLEAIGQLAGGIAHDFNNIVTAIQLQLELLEAEHRLVPAVSGVVSDVRASAERAANITRQLLLFSRRQEMTTRRIDLNTVVDDLLRMLTHLLGRRIAVRFERVDGAAYVDGDVGMIQQVLVNLCVNARDAMPDGGTITIRTRRLDVTDAAAVASPDAYAGRFVCLEVSDTGQGMSPETQARIFEPFFTTKDVGKGTGLGLATSHGIVVQHRGWIEVASALGVGTTFQVYLPLAGGESRPDASSRSATCAIVVLGEEGPTRRTTVRALRRLGHAVLEASDLAGALRLLAERTDVALVLADTADADESTRRELAERVRRTSPGVELVVMTNRAPVPVDGSGARMILKPFTLATLYAVVGDACGRRGDRTMTMR